MHYAVYILFYPINLLVKLKLNTICYIQGITIDKGSSPPLLKGLSIAKI